MAQGFGGYKNKTERGRHVQDMTASEAIGQLGIECGVHWFETGAR